MPVSFDIGSLIASKPGVNGGRPYIAVYDMQGYSPEQIVEHKPYLTLAHVHAGLLLGQ
jgi:uncharacterized protein (DUF433 family)